MNTYCLTETELIVTIVVVVVVIALIIICAIVIKKLTKNAMCTSQTCLTGKTALITGANTGIGYETAVDFAKRGARVIIACRSAEKAEDAKINIIKRTQNSNIVVKLIDMASFASVRKLAEQINSSESRLDILVNNAGVFNIGDERTNDGQLKIMQVNYYSHFLLTILLLGLLKRSGKSRIVNVSSIGARFGKIDLKKLDEFPGDTTAYSNSKLCNILFTIELAKKLQGSSVTVYSLHPGVVKTEIGRNMGKTLQNIINFMLASYFKTTVEGAQTTIYVSVTEGLEKCNGEHFQDCQVTKRYKSARNEVVGRQLWEKTESIVKLTPEERSY